MWRLLLYIPCLVIYSNLIFSNLVLGGDLTNINRWEMYNQTSHAYAWNMHNNNGLGGSNAQWLPYNLSYFSLNKIFYMVADNETAKRLIFFSILPLSLILVAEMSSKKVKNKIALVFGLLLYYVNPYVLMLVSGGQVGVMQSYAWSPVVILLAINWSSHHKVTSNILNYRLVALTLSLILLYAMDFRVGLLTTAFLTTLSFVTINNKQLFIALIKAVSFISISLFLVNAHVLASLLTGTANSVISNYTSTSSLEFFSFARFAHSLTWSHPNYPENIFGKVNEISAFSLFFPVIVFAAIKLKPTKLVVILTLIALISAFFIKGTNPPFGYIFQTLFESLPGMNLFRDSTKFFIPLSIAYAWLSAITFQELSIKLKNKNLVRYFLVSVSILIIIIAWYPTLNGQIKGTLKHRNLYNSHKQLETILLTDDKFGRVLYIPKTDIHHTSLYNHLAVSFSDLINPPSCRNHYCLDQKIFEPNYIFTRNDLSQEIQDKMELLEQLVVDNVLEQLGISYIVLVPDYDDLIYTHQYKPDRTIQSEYKYYLEKTPFLNKVQTNGNMVIYKVRDQASLLFNTTANKAINHKIISPSKYSFYWEGGEGEIKLAQNYDKGWEILNINSKVIAQVQKTELGLQKYQIEAPEGEYTIAYKPQQLVTLGWYISIISFCILIFLYILSLWRKN
jgi:hypothetical protein